MDQGDGALQRRHDAKRKTDTRDLSLRTKSYWITSLNTYLQTLALYNYYAGAGIAQSV
jgi:hypothetical protein